MSDKIIQVNTYPFSIYNEEPRLLMEKTGWEIRYNPYERRLKIDEVEDLIIDACGVIAGTEPYRKVALEKTRKLKVISRVGSGVDNVDLNVCKDLNIAVTYTPEAPADSVADLTVAQIINLLRKVYISDRTVREGLWNRVIGKLVSEVRIGVLGVGRIGKRVVRRLSAFGANIYGCDLAPDYQFGEEYNIKWVSKEKLFEICDLTTIHIPMNPDNYHCVGFEEISRMKKGSLIVNTSRGQVIDESSLLSLLESRYIGGAALDVFDQEPYEGPLTKLDNVILTAHIGSSTTYGRYMMELEATQDCIRVLEGKEPNNPVKEYYQ